jgi:hypothetical protein
VGSCQKVWRKPAFARDGIKAEADSNEEAVTVCDLDFDNLHKARGVGTVTPRLCGFADLFRLTLKYQRATGS